MGEQHSGNSVWVEILVEDAAIEKGSLIMMNMVKSQGGKGQVVTPEQSDTNGSRYLSRHLGLIRIK